MKTLLKILILFMGFLTASSANAQHLEFMGIPLNSTIANFQSKLLKKGCRIMKNNSRYPVGIRGFNGVFAGDKADIFVYYNPKTQIVYQARVAIDCDGDKEEANNLFNRYKDLLYKKYGEVSLTSDMLDEQKEFEYSFMVFQPPIQEGSKLLGGIIVSIKDLQTYPWNYKVVIDYTDIDNFSKNEKSEIDDL
ncbi:MAG: hypothetical protein IKQ47_09285 [Prevotella sp.]|nr:hypothetical protein [Prevotella sp.]